MRALNPIWDGDQGPGFRTTLDLGTGFDASHAAVVAYVVDSAGTTHGVRPCTIYGAKADRNFDVLMRGKETDFDGLGKDLFVIFRVHKAVTAARTPATNLLVNPSFDTYNATVAIASCTTTNTSSLVTSSAAFGDIYPGMTVTGTGIPANTFVDVVPDSSSLYLSNAATASGTVTLTFGRFGLADSWLVGGGSVTVSCTTNGTTALTSAAAFANVVAGDRIHGTFIAEGTTVLSKTDSSNITMSLAATGSSTTSRYFTHPGFGIGNMTFDVGADDPAPPVIFGSRQRAYATTVAGTTQVAYLTQRANVALVAGDYVSCGFWVRTKRDSGYSLPGEPGYYYTLITSGSPDSVQTFHTDGNRDWSFVRSELRITDTRTYAGLSLISYDALGYELRYDDAFLFKGKWAVYHTEAYELRVQPRPRPSKTVFSGATNFIGGRGGFEYDSNGDGVADGWAKTGTLTYTHETDPDHTNANLGLSIGAQKVALNASSTDRLRLIYRAHFKAGETWRFQVAYKNSGALSGSPANGDFGIVLHTEEFDGLYEESSLAGANFSLSSIATYVNKFRTLALTEDHSCLVLDINLKTASGGTIWLDDAIFFRSA